MDEVVAEKKAAQDERMLAKADQLVGELKGGETKAARVLQLWMGAALGAGDEDEAPHVFLPTGCYRLLRRLLAACPEHQLIIADFDWLPPQPSGSVCAPGGALERAEPCFRRI